MKENVTGIILSDGLTSIGNAAFPTFHKVTSITIPSSVTTIDHFAFSGCSSLSSVTVSWTNPQSITYGIEIFGHIDVLKITLYVPVGLAATYRDVPVWSFFNIREQQ
ncbi:MAG: leucine-rich repeat domain-containing protein [Bacteroidales bacterium]|nr:leucine-rich repeat domain-containing protein [Bacteroidales bacterium]